MSENDSLRDELGSLELLAALEPAQIEVLAAHAQRRNLHRDDFLFHAGTPGDSFFVLRSGQIKLSMLSQQGGEKVLSIVNPGATFAEGVVFMQEPRYPVSAQALCASEVWGISAHRLRSLLNESFPTCLKLLEHQTRRIQALLAEVEAQTLESAHHRLIAYLLRQAGERSSLCLPASKVVIAAQLAVKPETLSRLFAELQRRRLIIVDGRDIRILNRQSLLNLKLEPVLRP